MNVFLDENTCVGCGYCAAASPEYFGMDGLKAFIRREAGAGAGVGAVAGLSAAVAACPVRAVVIDVDDGGVHEAAGPAGE